MAKREWSRGGLLHLNACPACGAEAVAAQYARRDDSLTMPDVWRVHQCGACGSMYLVDRPDDESLPRAYADYYTHKQEVEDLFNRAGVIPRLVNGYLNKRFKMHRANALGIGYPIFRVAVPFAMKLDMYGRHMPTHLCGSGKRLLDVGCGNGAFLLRAREMGFCVDGCEPDPSAAALCRASGLNVVTGDVWGACYKSQSFDYISMSHVIEHVTDAPRLLEKLSSLLNPGGTIWLALPNPSALGVRLFRRGWAGLHPPFHLLIPHQRVLERWLRDAGFTHIRFIRRGVQSPSLWRESIRIAMREGIMPQRVRISLTRLLGNMLGSLSHRWGEETVVMASRPGADNGP